MPSCGWQLWGRRRGSRAKRFFCSLPTPPPSLPHPRAQGEGRLSLVSSRRPLSLPCSRRRSPGSILSRRSGEGAAGGGRSHSLPYPAGQTAGTPRGSVRTREVPGYVAGLRSSSLRPPDSVPRKEPSAPTGRGGARPDGKGWVDRGHRVSAPPRQRDPAGNRLVGRSVRPGCSPRESGDSEEALLPPPPPIPALAGSSLSSRPAGLTLCWLLGGGSSSPSSPLILGPPSQPWEIAKAVFP